MIYRNEFLERLFKYKDKPLIKVITGIRRCGKSVILKLLQAELVRQGVAEERIIYLDFESFQWSALKRAGSFYEYISNRISRENRCYLLFDEIQEVAGWERAINSFSVDFNVDIYITGSNSHILSSELATFLSGRYVELNLFTLSFSEHLLFRESLTGKSIEDLHGAFTEYLRTGGFPVLHMASCDQETAMKIVYDIYSSVILRDVVQRYKIRDVELLERVVRFVFDNVGNKFSAGNVVDYFKSQYRKIDINTVYNYLNALEGAFIVHRIPRYDIKGKEILKTNEKYFVGDHGLVYAVMGYRDRFISGILENIVMSELLRRGYRVFTGKSNEREIDFIAEKNERKVYVQVAYKISEPATFEREFSVLLEIRDHHPKYVVTMDEVWRDNVDGVKHLHIADFLLLAEF
ncbi:MAG: ATP-binding protein [Prolixibacteraceae bacterium]